MPIQITYMRLYVNHKRSGGHFSVLGSSDPLRCPNNPGNLDRPLFQSAVPVPSADSGLSLAWPSMPDLLGWNHLYADELPPEQTSPSA